MAKSRALRETMRNKKNKEAGGKKRHLYTTGSRESAKVVLLREGKPTKAGGEIPAG